MLVEAIVEVEGVVFFVTLVCNGLVFASVVAFMVLSEMGLEGTVVLESGPMEDLRKEGFVMCEEESGLSKDLLLTASEVLLLLLLLLLRVLVLGCLEERDSWREVKVGLR